MNKTAIITALILLALAAGGGSYYWHKNKSPETAIADAGKGPKGPTPVVTETLAPTTLTQSLSAVGSLIAGESADIHTEIAGQIQKISFEEGQPVKKGDILLQIDNSLIQTEFSKAKAEYEATSATFRRDDKLRNSGFVSNQKWDMSKSDLESNRAAVENARIKLEKMTIRAPFDGIAGLRNFSVGDYADTGQMLTNIVSIDPLKTEFSIPERSYTSIKTGQTVTFSVDAFPNETFSGEIYAIDPRIDTETRNFKVKASIPNSDLRLRPGMYARIDIATITRDNIIMVAEEALLPQGEENYVFVVDAGNKATRRKVTLGVRDKGRAEITEGLSAGDIIITAGTMRLRDGMEVAPQSPDTAQPAAGE